MYELKKIAKVFTSKFVGIGPSSYKKKNLPGRGLTKVEKHCSKPCLSHLSQLQYSKVGNYLHPVMPKHCPLHPALEQNLPLMRHTRFHSHTNQRQARFTLWVRSLSIQDQGQYSLPVSTFSSLAVSLRTTRFLTLTEVFPTLTEVFLP